MTTFKEYRNEINKIFSRYIRGGFVDYYHCRGLSRDMIDLMIDATKELSSRGEYKELFDLANKGFLKWGKTNKDDSDGETQDFVYYVEQAWGQSMIPVAKEFFMKLRKHSPRYVYPQCNRIRRMRKVYTEEQIVDGFGFCVSEDICSVKELTAFLLCRHGEEISRKFVSTYSYRHYKDRADDS